VFDDLGWMNIFNCWRITGSIYLDYDGCMLFNFGFENSKIIDHGKEQNDFNELQQFMFLALGLNVLFYCYVIY